LNVSIVALALLSTLVAQDTGPATLAGVALGGPAKDAAAAHKGAASKGAWGAGFAWNAPGTGSVRITADDDGNVAIVDVVPASPSIDLPAAKAFPVAQGHEKYSELSTFIESDTCRASKPGDACYAYTLDDGELVLQFGASGTGPLHEAIWGDRSTLKTLGIIQAGASI